MDVPAMDQELLLIIGIVAAVIVVALIVAAIVVASRRRKERERLKERFGPEYEHAVKSEGSRRAVDDLHGRVEERESFSPVDPGEATRTALRRRMATLQYRFVEDPPDVLLETQRVVIDALRACGYPVAEDRERAMKLLSVDYPQVTPSVRTLLEGSYGRDMQRMQTLFVDAKRALREVVRLGYGPDDVGAAPSDDEHTPRPSARATTDEPAASRADERPVHERPASTTRPERTSEPVAAPPTRVHGDG